MLTALGEYLAACAYAAVLFGMGLVTLTGATVFLLLRVTWWAYCLPGRFLGGEKRK